MLLHEHIHTFFHRKVIEIGHPKFLECIHAWQMDLMGRIEESYRF